MWHPPTLRGKGAIFILAEHHWVIFCVAEHGNPVVVYKNIPLRRSDQQKDARRGETVYSMHLAMNNSTPVKICQPCQDAFCLCGRRDVRIARGGETCTNKLYLFFVCLTRIVLQIVDDIAIDKIWQDQIRDRVMNVTQSKDADDIWMVEAVGDLGVLAKTLNGYGDELVRIFICLRCA